MSRKRTSFAANNNTLIRCCWPVKSHWSRDQPSHAWVKTTSLAAHDQSKHSVALWRSILIADGEAQSKQWEGMKSAFNERRLCPEGRVKYTSASTASCLPSWYCNGCRLLVAVQRNLLLIERTSCVIAREGRSRAGTPEQRKGRGVMELIKKKIVTTYACVCAATMLTSKIITEITETHLELYVCANSCNELVSIRSW